MRDWTRAVVFGGWGAVPAWRPTGGRLSGDKSQKAWVMGWPPVTMPVVSKPFGGMPSHPSVRHYDRSEPMRLTNPGCGEAVAQTGPFEASTPSLSPQPEAARIEAGAKCGSLDREIRAGGAARRSTQHHHSAKTAPPPLKGQAGFINPAQIACGLVLFARRYARAPVHDAPRPPPSVRVAADPCRRRRFRAVF